jgi:hypothetical protein
LANHRRGKIPFLNGEVEIGVSDCYIDLCVKHNSYRAAVYLPDHAGVIYSNKSCSPLTVNLKWIVSREFQLWKLTPPHFDSAMACNDIAEFQIDFLSYDSTVLMILFDEKP